MKVAMIGPACRDRNSMDGRVYESLGGTVFHTGNALAALGVEVTFFVAIGPDVTDWRTNFPASNVFQLPVAGTHIHENIETSAQPGVRVCRAQPADMGITIEHFRDHDLSRYDYIILGPLFHTDLTKEFVSFASRFPGKLVLEPQGMIRYLENGSHVFRHPENVVSVLSEVDIFISDAEEAAFITQRKEKDEAISFILDRGVAQVIITQGERGSIIATAQERHQIPAFSPSTIVHPIGAGDTYLAGFIKAQELFTDPSQQGSFAAMAATLSLEQSDSFSQSTEVVLARLRRKP